MEARHKYLTQTEGVHTPFAWIWADATERAATETEAEDLYKMGFQVDTTTVYVCTDPSVPTFTAI